MHAAAFLVLRVNYLIQIKLASFDFRLLVKCDLKKLLTYALPVSL